MMPTVLSLLVLTAIALVVGAAMLWRRHGSRLQIVLMLVLAAIICGNIAIWVVPIGQGSPPLARSPE
jgi:uncharacterized membrane protein